MPLSNSAEWCALANGKILAPILAAGNNNSASVLFIEDVPDTIQYTCLGEIQELTAALRAPNPG